MPKSTKCIDDEIPFGVPNNWEWVRLNSIRSKEIKRGKSPKYTSNGNILVFAQKCNTKYDGIDISLCKYLNPLAYNKYDETEKILDGDIIINSTGTGTMGRIGYYSSKDNPENYILVPDSHVTIVRVSKALNSLYIKYTIDHYHKFFEKNGEGSTNQKELKPITIQNLLIPIPPVNEQQIIVTRIKYIDSILDNLQ